MVEVINQSEVEENAESAEEPGLFENYGTFPVWMLKVIQLATPSFLILQNLPKKTEDNTKS
tara:strand:- start:264 stop:446 length:183 start_codon:yes stop_codon:yes gene_type:complete